MVLKGKLRAMTTLLVAWAMLQSSASTVWVTTYADKFEGRRTKSDEVYTHRNYTVAVPRDRWKAFRGKRLLFSRPPYVLKVYARVTDTTGPGVRNYDLSRGAWETLTQGAAPSRIRVRMEAVE